MQNNDGIIQVDHLVKDYQTGAGPVRVLDDVSLEIHAGEFVAVVGPSGSGKSTLINMLTGIDRPSDGSVIVGGTRLNDLSENQVARWRGRTIGVIFQFFQLLPTLTLLENVMLPMDFCNTFPVHERKSRAMALLDQVGLADQAHKLPGAVSGGQQQRAAIARALANDPPLLMGDEPTGNLDSTTADQVFRMFAELTGRGKTIVMVTHDRELAARMPARGPGAGRPGGGGMMSRLRTILRKALRDLWGNRSRTLLVALSVAAGVLGIGAIVATWNIMTVDLARRYAAINPAHVEIAVPAGVAVDDVKGLLSVPGVTAVQGRAVFDGRYLANDGSWQTFEAIAVPDFDAQAIDKIAHEDGAWPPGRGQAVIERSAISETGLHPGDSVTVEAQGHERALQIVGTAHQQDDFTAVVKGTPLFLVDLDTMVSLQGHDRLNTLYLTVDDLDCQAAVGDEARNRLERTGYTVVRVTLHDPAIYPAQDSLTVLFLVMGLLGVLSLILSGFLVTNTISALVAQQIKQIGMMKAIGADAGLVFQVYSLTVLAYGALGTLVAVPLGSRAGYLLAGYLAGRINVDLYPYRLSLPALGSMAVVGLVVPLLAALPPLRTAARITVREAISDYELGGGSGGNHLSLLLSRIRNLPRTWALALRNTVRVPARLVLTLITLTLAGATFIAVLSTNDSFSQTVANQIEGQRSMDAIVAFQQEERSTRVVALAEAQPGVSRAEAWYFGTATMRVPSGQEVQVMLQAGPQDTAFYRPRMLAGRWLLPEDGQAIVVSHKWAEEEGVAPGDVVTLDLGADYPTSDWVVAGINEDLTRQSTGVFVPLESLDRVLKRMDHTYTLEVQYDRHDAASQRQQTSALVEALQAHGVDVFSTQVLEQIKSQVTSLYRIVVIFLLVMAVLMAIVGGIGLMGMMSINVLERSKEIGVMRAIGAGTPDILRIFLGETIVVAFVSFLLSVALSWPLAWWMARLVGDAFIGMPLDFSYATQGVWYWLVIALGLGTLASLAPALGAANLSVRESLSYE